ncbi:MAG: hypothetical protein GY679_02685 [Mycoplasma sp.]|nr:hypothetical protein [Mycoplasma sp.]
MTIINSIFNNRNRTDNKEVEELVNKLKPFNFKIINVVGTNGKGSVSNYLTTNLMTKYKVGTFTSPHIFKANERIKVNNVSIPTKKLEVLISKYKDLHFFAIMYLCALEHFKEQGCEVVILEAGVGGKYDTTNTLSGDVGVITSIGLDHMELLGSTEREILKDKIGIINKGMNFYFGTELLEFNELIEEKVTKMKAKHFVVVNQFNDYKSRNKALAKEILKNEFNILKPIFVDPIGRTTIQEINNSKAIIDVAHNKAGIAATLELLKKDSVYFEQVVITMSKRKDWKDLKKLFLNKKIFAYQLKDDFISAQDLGVEEVDDLRVFYKKQNKNTLYIGSFYSVGEILDVK